jgi:hypothetical protein
MSHESARERAAHIVGFLERAARASSYVVLSLLVLISSRFAAFRVAIGNPTASCDLDCSP